MLAHQLSDLVLRLMASAMESSVTEHQGRMVEFLRDAIPFDAAWWGWSNLSGGRLTIVRSTTHALPRSFESAVRAVMHIDPFVRHGRSLPVFSMTQDLATAVVDPAYRSFAEAFRLQAILNGHCRLGAGSSFNFFMSLYRHQGAVFSQAEAADFRIILRHLEQSLSLSLRAEIRARAPQGGEAAVVDHEGQLVRASRGFLPALAAEGLAPRSRAAVLRRLGVGQGQWQGQGVVLKSEPYAEDLTVIRMERPGLWDLLAPQERRVAELVLSGLTMREIAASHRVSPHTVRNQLATIYRKTGAAGKMDLARRLGPSE
ncbi:helix-turn-helix transcriptional regulator [Gemmobacter denitrificans]|uniref:Helix-turn-helix transcriptional regulator n=1 Tax=Gemmobacter denitrificans TaxID=3123040 RepID=A0ABU8BV70_9RHOB